MFSRRQRMLARLAWRDLRASSAQTGAVIAIAAAGIAGLVAIRGSAAAFDLAVRQDVLAQLGGDMAIELSASPTPNQLQTLSRLTSTTVVFTSAAIRSGHNADPVPAIVKAVDPRLYPLRGNIELQPRIPLELALSGASVVVSPLLLRALDAHIGDTIRLQNIDCRISAVLAVEPDRITGLFASPLRLLASVDTLEKSALLRNGAPSLNRLLLRLPPGASLADTRQRMEAAFPDAGVFEPAEDRPSISDALENTRSLFRAVGWLALALGVLGTAPAAKLHLSSRLQTLAVLKQLGGSPRDIWHWLIVELVILGACATSLGTVAGLAAGYASLAAVHLDPALFDPPWLAVPALGFLVPVAVAWRAARQAAKMRPNALLQSAAPQRLPARWTRWRHRISIPLILRQAFTNLARPATGDILVFTIAAGLTWFGILALAGEQTVAGALVLKSPISPGANLFLTAIPDDRLEGVLALLHHRGIEPQNSVLHLAWIRITSERPPRRRLAACTAGLPSGYVALDSQLALQLGGVKAGEPLVFEVGERSQPLTVSQVRTLSPAERIFSSIEFSCSDARRGDLFHHAGLQLDDSRVLPLLVSLHRQFPDVTVQTSEDVKAMFHTTGWTAVYLVRFLAFQVAFSGAILLVLVLSANLRRRHRILALYQALGATPAWVRRLLTVESGLLLLTGGLTGILLTVAATSLALSAMYQQPVLPERWGLIALSAVAVFLPGLAACWWISSYHLRRFRRPGVSRILDVALP